MLLNSLLPSVSVTGTSYADPTTQLGLHGMGGIGKTVLAIALVNDEALRRALPDGVFWITWATA